MFRNFIFLITICLLASCRQNPYPEEGTFREVQRLEPVEPLPELSMAVSDVIEFNEGRYREYKIRVAVKGEGTPVVKIEDLPNGAIFEPETYTLKWRPSFFDGNNSNDPSEKLQIYPITVWLRSSSDSIRALRRRINLLVYDVPRDVEIKFEKGASKNSVREGSLYSHPFEIIDPDYPKGDFRLALEGMPTNMQLKKEGDKDYRLIFTPDHLHVHRAKRGASVTYNGKVIVSNPANHTYQQDLRITVHDVRINPKLVAPKEITQGLDVNLQVVAYDLNQEMSPSLEMSGRRPEFGNFKLETTKNEENFSTVLNINWSDIPPAKNGEVHRLVFRTCVTGRDGRRNLCKNETTKVTTLVRDREPPHIDRENWPIGELVYLGFNQKLERLVSVMDRENRRLRPDVEIFPESMRPYVKWQYGRLRLQFDQPGIFQFSLRATSLYKMSSAESFIVEVFPEDRKRTLLFADSTRDPEVRFYKKAFDNMDIMNPAIQNVGLRDISGRNLLVLTTSTLMDETVAPEVLAAINQIPNVMIASPLIDNLPSELLDKWTERYHFHPIGRYSQLPNSPGLNRAKLAKTSQFGNSKHPVALKMKTTPESFDPMIFNGGLDEVDKICKGVLGLTSTGNNPYVLGLVCQRSDRQGGGRLAILGTEWADFDVSSDDSRIPFQWFNTMLWDKF